MKYFTTLITILTLSYSAYGSNQLICDALMSESENLSLDKASLKTDLEYFKTVLTKSIKKGSPQKASLNNAKSITSLNKMSLERKRELLNDINEILQEITPNIVYEINEEIIEEESPVIEDPKEYTFKDIFLSMFKRKVDKEKASKKNNIKTKEIAVEKEIYRETEGLRISFVKGEKSIQNYKERVDQRLKTLKENMNSLEYRSLGQKAYDIYQKSIPVLKRTGIVTTIMSAGIFAVSGHFPPFLTMLVLNIPLIEIPVFVFKKAKEKFHRLTNLDMNDIIRKSLQNNLNFSHASFKVKSIGALHIAHKEIKRSEVTGGISDYYIQNEEDRGTFRDSAYNDLLVNTLWTYNYLEEKNNRDFAAHEEALKHKWTKFLKKAKGIDFQEDFKNMPYGLFDRVETQVQHIFFKNKEGIPVLINVIKTEAI